MRKISSITERFVNLFTSDQAERDLIKDEVYKILFDSYASIGGLAGSGLSSPDDMVKNMLMWKLIKKDGKIIGVIMYKDKEGRKKVAIGTNGTAEAKKQLLNVLKADFDRAYSEVSSSSLRFQAKNFGYPFILKYAKTLDEVRAISKDPIEPVDDNDPEVKAHPLLKDYFYSRIIGGEPHTKIMLGTHGKKIVDSF